MILFYGPAGSGKSTQGKILAEKYGWKYIPSGELLREKAKTDKKLAEVLERGDLVPSEVINELVFQAVDPVGGGHVIIDGYPREAQELDDLVERYSPSMIAVAVVLELSEEESIQRLKLRGRSDDDDEGIRRRLEIYNQEMGVILKILDKYRVLVIKIDGSPGIEAISDNIEKELKKWHIL